MQTTLNSLLHITVKHTYLRGNTFYFRRPIPKDLQGLTGRATVKKNLHTTDPIEAARRVAKIKDELESEWAMLRGDIRTCSPRVESNQQEESAIAIDSLAAQEASLAQPPTPSLLSNKVDVGISSAMDFYFQTHEKGNKPSFQRLPRISVRQFINAIGEKLVTDITRDDVRVWMEHAVEKGHSKNTIVRRLACLKAIMSMFIREKELGIPNRFEKHTIPSNAVKAKKRNSFSTADLHKAQSACKQTDDDVRWITAMLSDSCSRLAEIVGLRLSDIVIDEVPPDLVPRAF